MVEALASCESPPILVVDQFEETFLLTASDEQARSFCARLAAHATGVAPVIVTIRADHVAGLGVSLEFARLAERGLHLVTALSGEPLRQAIEGPALQAGLRIEPGLVDLLVRDCEGEPGAMPLLSHALAETWQRRDGRVLTVEGYRATGEIRGAVARSADRLYESLPAGQRAKLRSLLLRLVTSSPDGEPVRSRIATRALGGDIERERVLGLLVRARLVTAEEDSVELAHEALARAWPRLRSWLDEDATGQRIFRHLSAAAEGWESLGRPDSELYRGARLEAVLEWQSVSSPDLTDLEQSFVGASVVAANAARERHAREARTQVKQRRRLRRALAAVAALIIASTVGGFAAYRERETNQRERREAGVQALLSRSEVLRSRTPDVAALLAVEAYHIAPSPATESALFATFTGGAIPRRIRRTDLNVSFGAAAVLVPNTDTMAIADHHGVVHLIDTPTGEGRRLAPIVDRTGYTELAVSGDGRYLVGLFRSGVQEPDHSVLTVWDVPSGERRFEPVIVDHVSRSVTINGDGSVVVVGGSSESPVQVRDGATGALRSAFDPISRVSDDDQRSGTDSVHFGPDGQLAIVSRTGVIRLVDLTTGDELNRLEGEPLVVPDAAFSRDGSVLVTISSGGFVVWDIERHEITTSADLDAGCRIVVVAEPIDNVLCATVSGPVIAYDLATGREVRRFDAPPIDSCALAVNPEGTTFVKVASCADGTAQLLEWQLSGYGPVNRLAFDTSSPHAVAGYGFAGDSTSLVVNDGPFDDHETIVVDSAGEVIDRLPEVRQLLPTNDPRVAIAVLTDGAIVNLDVVRHTEIGPRVDVGFDTEWAWAGGGHVVVFGEDDSSHGRLQGVDLEMGQLVEPAIDSNGEFEIGWYDTTSDSLYMMVTRDGREWIERRDVTNGDLLQASTDGYVDFDVEAEVLVAKTDGGQVLELDALSLEPIGSPFPSEGEEGVTLLSEDGSRLLVADGISTVTVRVYDVATRVLLGDPFEHQGSDDVGWSVIRPDGLEVAIDTVDGIVVWDLDPAHWVNAACEFVGRNLTRAEWDEHMGDLFPYRRTCPAYPEV